MTETRGFWAPLYLQWIDAAVNAITTSFIVGSLSKLLIRENKQCWRVKNQTVHHCNTSSSELIYLSSNHLFARRIAQNLSECQSVLPAGVSKLIRSTHIKDISTSASRSRKNGAASFSTIILRNSWAILCFSVPVETEINTVQFAYLLTWWRHKCTTMHITKF